MDNASKDAPVFGFAVSGFILKSEPPYIFSTGSLRLNDISSPAFIALTKSKRLSLGLKLFESNSTSRPCAEVRAETAEGANEREVDFRFTIIGDVVSTSSMALLAKIDLLYEDRFWFDERIKSAVFIATENPNARNESSDRPSEVFEYYRARVVGAL